MPWRIDRTLEQLTRWYLPFTRNVERFCSRSSVSASSHTSTRVHGDVHGSSVLTSSDTALFVHTRHISRGCIHPAVIITYFAAIRAAVGLSFDTTHTSCSEAFFSFRDHFGHIGTLYHFKHLHFPGVKSCSIPPSGHASS